MDKTTFVTGDFDHNGKTDYMETTRGPAGSVVHYSTGVGTWSTTTYSRPDLVIDSMVPVVGDFDGDGFSDLILSTPRGTFWYYGTGLGTFDSTSAAPREDLRAGTVKFTVGNFDGQTGDDMIITTNTGSYWYYSTGPGHRGLWDSSNPSYQRTDLPTGVATFKTGDFDNNGMKDIIITTAAGSFWYYSLGRGLWNTTAYQDGTLTTGNVQFAVLDPSPAALSSGGDVTNDKQADVIVSTSSGSTWYYSGGMGAWDKTVYPRSDLPM